MRRRRQFVARRRVRQRRAPTQVRGRFAGPAAVEQKFFETDVDDAVVAQNWNVNGSMNLVPQGVTEAIRVGRKMTITFIGIRLAVTLPTTATAAETSDVIRIVLVQDKQCNGANPAVTQVFENNTWQSFNNLANSGRFVTLMDRVIPLNSRAGSGRGSTDTLSYGADVKVITLFKKVNIPIEFDAGTGAVTEIRSNNLVLLYGSQLGFGGIDGTCRIRFSDR